MSLTSFEHLPRVLLIKPSFKAGGGHLSVIAGRQFFLVPPYHTLKNSGPPFAYREKFWSHLWLWEKILVPPMKEHLPHINNLGDSYLIKVWVHTKQLQGQPTLDSLTLIAESGFDSHSVHSRVTWPWMCPTSFRQSLTIHESQVTFFTSVDPYNRVRSH